MSCMRTWPALAAAAVVLATGALSAVPTAPAQELRDTQEDESKVWKQRYRAALEAEQTSRLALAEAEAAYRRGRSRHTLRGDERVAAFERVEALREQHREASRALAALPEEARRAGALPGWLRDARSAFEEDPTGTAEPGASKISNTTPTAPPASAERAIDGADTTR
jgi:hypothetical protein